MTLTDLLPVRIGLRDKPTGKRRQDDAIDLLQCKLAGARMLIKGLRLQLDDQALEHAKTIARIEARHGETVRGLENELAEARRRTDIASRAETAVTKTQKLSLDEIQRHCVLPLHQSPMAVTDPGRVPPSWAKSDGAA